MNYKMQNERKQIAHNRQTKRGEKIHMYRRNHLENFANFFAPSDLREQHEKIPYDPEVFARANEWETQ